MKDDPGQSSESQTSIAVDPLSVTIIGSFDELATVAKEWDDFVARSGSDIYFVFDWLEAWWTYYGKDRGLRCFLIRKNGAAVAALPFFTQSFGSGPLRLKIARFVGADFTVPVFLPAIEKGHEIEVLAYVFEDLFSIERCDCVNLSPLSDASLITNATREICAGNDNYEITRDDSINTHTFFTLPDSFAGYLKQLSKKAGINFRRNLRGLSRLYELESRIFSGTDAIDHFDEFVKLHGAQWAGTGKLGHFGDWPESLAFNRDLVERLGKRDLVQIHGLIGSGETLALQYIFVFADRSYWRLPARQSGAEIEKLGLGQIGLLKMLEALIDQGIKHAEAGPGHYDYKISYGGQESALRRLIVTRSSTFTRHKAHLFLLFFDLIHLIYYRIWFLKIAPRIPFLKFPLWRTWIRTRL